MKKTRTIWLPFRVHYRWLPSTVWRNIRGIVEDIYYGIKNVCRWAPVIWFDADFDWEYLANVMEYKLRRMSHCLANGHHLRSNSDARQTLVCAELIHRLREDEYFVEAQKSFPGDAWSVKGGTFAALHAKRVSENDKRYLGLLIGKYLNHWWD